MLDLYKHIDLETMNTVNEHSSENAAEGLECLSTPASVAICRICIKRMRKYGKMTRKDDPASVQLNTVWRFRDWKCPKCHWLQHQSWKFSAGPTQAGMVFVAGKTVWSIPESFKVVCIPCKVLYEGSVYFYLYLLIPERSYDAPPHTLPNVPTLKSRALAPEWTTV